MLKIFQKEVEFPLAGKIRIQGLRSETSPHPSYTFTDDLLKIQDTWAIQLAYSLLEKRNSQAAPEFLEYKVAWEDEIPWPENLSRQISITYKTKPHSLTSYIKELPGNKLLLLLTLEAALEITYPPEYLPKEQESLTKEQEPLLKEQEPVIPWEEKFTRLETLIGALENRVKAMEELVPELCQPYSSLSGRIVDAFRLIPVVKAEIELTRDSSGSPIYKTISNNRGIYFLDRLTPGTYDVTVRHPRFLPLVIKGYVVKEDEDKNQDFLLRRL